MSEQIREQVSAFLDGELPNSEMELLLKRLTRDAELRQSFGRYALIGETLRGASRTSFSRGFATRINRAIDGEPVTPGFGATRARQSRWWKPVAGTAVAAGVAAVAVIALQQRAEAPGVRARAPLVAQSLQLAQPKEAISYTVPAAAPTEAPAMVPAARFTSYVFAHSKYSVGLGQSNLLSALLSEEPVPADPAATNDAEVQAAGGAPLPEAPAQQPQRDTHTRP